MRQTLITSMGMGIGLALALAPVAADARPMADGTFLQDAISGSNGEITLGRLAQSRAGDPKVREFGRVLVRDHRAAKQQALSVARAARVRIDAQALTPDATDAERRLSRMKGRGFDRMFVHHMVEDHEKDIARFEQQSRSRDLATARLARQTLPHLRHHLEIARSLER